MFKMHKKEQKWVEKCSYGYENLPKGMRALSAIIVTKKPTLFFHGSWSGSAGKYLDQAPDDPTLNRNEKKKNIFIF